MPTVARVSIKYFIFLYIFLHLIYCLMWIKNINNKQVHDNENNEETNKINHSESLT